MLSTPVFSGRVAVITGGAQGIGRATAAALASQGARIVLVDVRADPLRETAEALGAAAWVLDVTDPAAWQEVVDEIERDVGPIDILVNNAGIMKVGPFLEASPRDHDLQLDVNVAGVMAGMRTVLPRMVRRGRGHVVNIASTAGRVGTPFVAVYSASKFAVIGLTEAVRREIRHSGVSLSYVCPAPVNTPLLTGLKPLRWPPNCEPEEVAEAVLRCVRDGVVEVYVPRAARLAVILPAILPRRLNEAIGRLLGAYTIFEDPDHDARATYDAQYTGPVKA